MSKKIQEYITYLSPEFIYVPYDKIENLQINRNKKVYYNSHLGKYDNNKNIFSPVSGKIIGIKEMRFLDKNRNCLVIENDFIDKREKLNPARNISQMKKQEIINSLEKYGLNHKNNKSIMVVNSLYDKKYDLKDMVINHELYEEILETIDEIMSVFNYKTCYICVDRNDLFSINAYEKYINAFLNICLVHSNRKLKKEECVYYSVEDILAMYKAIHQDYMYDNNIITIYDDKPCIVKVKLYTSLCELLKVLKISYKSKSVYINGKLVDDIKDFIIDKDIRSIVVKGNSK